MSKFKTQRGLLRLTAAAIFVAATGFAFTAQAGECPPELRKPNARLRQLPLLTGKQAYVFTTYAVDAGHALEKLADIVEDRGATVRGGRIVSRFHVARDCDEIVGDIVARVGRGTVPS